METMPRMATAAISSQKTPASAALTDSVMMKRLRYFVVKAPSEGKKISAKRIRTRKTTLKHRQVIYGYDRHLSGLPLDCRMVPGYRAAAGPCPRRKEARKRPCAGLSKRRSSVKFPEMNEVFSERFIRGFPKEIAKILTNPQRRIAAHTLFQTGMHGAKIGGCHLRTTAVSCLYPLIIGTFHMFIGDCTQSPTIVKIIPSK